MKSSLVSRIAVVVSLIMVAALALAIPAEGGYHLLKKYTFGAAEAVPASIFTTSRSIPQIAAFTCRTARK